jgi:CoA:oxalate CoA-transferase
MLAAEMGADVIKVEPPGGDEMRHWPPFINGESVYFVSCNRGKRSIIVDLKTPEGIAISHRLISRADVVVENFRPGTLEKFGLGWADLSSTLDQLIWVSISGYGRTGPRARDPAYDSMMQAFSGIMGITGERNRPPVRSGGSPIDIATAYLAWGSIMAGLNSRAATGRGVLLEVSLMESALGFLHAYLQGALVGLPMPARMGSETAGMYPMGAFQAQDGEYCLVQVSSDLQWKRFCTVLEMSKLAVDPQFTTNPMRVKNRDVLRPIIEGRLRTRSAREWENLFGQAGVPASYVRSLIDVIKEEQVLARAMIKSVSINGGCEIPTWGVPIKIDGEAATDLMRVPSLDEHRNEILTELE